MLGLYLVWVRVAYAEHMLAQRVQHMLCQEADTPPPDPWGGRRNPVQLFDESCHLLHLVGTRNELHQLVSVTSSLVLIARLDC